MYLMLAIKYASAVLSTMAGAIGQRDSEILLSSLTVPYLRIPFVVSFFATEDRVHALKNPTLQMLLDSVVFEPSRYLPKSCSSPPEFVPAKDETKLNTPYGLLLNELSRSPTQVVKSTLLLMKLALALDTGSYFGSQTDIILYVMRFGCRVLSFIKFVLYNVKTPTYRNRDMPVEHCAVVVLEQAFEDFSELLDTKYYTMIQSWTAECITRANAVQEEKRHKKKKSNDIEKDRKRKNIDDFFNRRSRVGGLPAMRAGCFGVSAPKQARRERLSKNEVSDVISKRARHAQ